MKEITFTKDGKKVWIMLTTPNQTPTPKRGQALVEKAEDLHRRISRAITAH